MLINLKKYVLNITYKYRTKLQNIDDDFWGNIFIYELEE